MEKTIHFIAGLPFSGATLLCNILAQNPRFEPHAGSGLLPVVAEVIGQWEAAFSEMHDARKVRTFCGILHNCYRSSRRPTIFDSCRAWLECLPMLEAVLHRTPKIVVMVRDIAEVLAEVERRWREASALSLTNLEQKHPTQSETVAGRCDIWMRGDEMVGKEYGRIVNAVRMGAGDRLHFVDYEQLTNRPQETLDNLYKFLGETPYGHDFERVEQVTGSVSAPFGIRGPHGIRSAVRPIPRRAREVLGALADKYKGPYIWDEPLPNGRPK